MKIYSAITKKPIGEIKEKNNLWSAYDIEGRLITEGQTKQTARECVFMEHGKLMGLCIEFTDDDFIDSLMSTYLNKHPERVDSYMEQDPLNNDLLTAIDYYKRNDYTTFFFYFDRYVKQREYI